MARKFFYVCAGLLCLMLAYHLGARNATAQAGTGWFISGVGSGSAYVTTASGDVWRYVPGIGWLNDLGNIFGAESGGRSIVSLIPGEVVTSTGEVWFSSGGVPYGQWINAGVPPLGPTSAQQETWGALKGRYR